MVADSSCLGRPMVRTVGAGMSGVPREWFAGAIGWPVERLAPGGVKERVAGNRNGAKSGLVNHAGSILQ